jgi:VWFA-related protein
MILRFRSKAAQALAVAVAASASIGAAQDSTQNPGAAAAQNPPTIIKVDVNQVLVPVVVTDRHGHTITGLEAADFAVAENGDPQRLTGFSTENDLSATTLNAGSPATSGAALPVPSNAVIPQGAARRTFIICLDTLNSSFGNLAGVVAALHKLFKREEGSDSRYALIALGRQPMLIRDLTSNPGEILAALDNKNLTRAIGQSESTNMAQQEAELTERLQEYCERCPCAGAPASTGLTAGGSDQVCGSKRSGLEVWAGSAAQERTLLTRSFLSDLRSLVDNLARQPGKRDLILISDGFNLRPGRDLFGLLALYFQNPTEEMQNPGDSLGPEVEEIVRLATARDVTFYTLDSRGLYASGAGALDASQELQFNRAGPILLPQIQQQKDMISHENEDAMTELAVATGGVFYHNSNDLLKGLRQAFADGREYYLLAYASSHKTADGKFREIRVDVKRKDAVVRAKRGYWAPSP